MATDAVMVEYLLDRSGVTPLNERNKLRDIGIGVAASFVPGTIYQYNDPLHAQYSLSSGIGSS